ncbi:MAG TPA: hypothetical protein VF755_14740 [Catenuloplanes sp.]
MNRPGRSFAADDTGSLPLAMLVTLVGMMLSGLLVSVVVAQTHATRVELQRTTALQGAHAGLDVAMARVGNTAGRSSLPCGPPLSGSVLPPGADGPAPNDARFEVLIDYFSTDPRPLTEAQLAPDVLPADTPGKISCASGSGPQQTPAFALLRSTGRDATGARRTMRATYTFRTRSANIAGGLIRMYGADENSQRCLDAGPSPVPGGGVAAQACDRSLPQQAFAYNPNLTISLPSSKSATRQLGLCLDAGAAPYNEKDPVKLQTCASTTQPQQQWSYNTYRKFMGTDDGVGTADFCLDTFGPQVGSAIVLGKGSNLTCGGGNETAKWRPDASVGAGAAGAASKQVVNYAQFGRCLDLVAFELIQPVGSHSVQAYPCKQAPDPSNVDWNQRWEQPALPGGAISVPGTLRVTSSADRNEGYAYRAEPHCLTTVPVPDGYPTLAPCRLNSPAMTWTFHGEGGSARDRFTIVDVHNRCLAAEPIEPAHPERARPVAVTACDGSSLQKWNAPPYTQDPLPLKDINER